MPVPSVWVITRRPKRLFVAVAGGLKGAEALVERDAERRATKAGIPWHGLTIWREHGEAGEGTRRFTSASIHVASRDRPEWTLTYDCRLERVHQQYTPNRGRRTKKEPAPALEEVTSE